MTTEQNVRAVIECVFSEAREDLQDIAVDRILELVEDDNPVNKSLSIKDRLLEELSKEPEQVIALAHTYAKNLILYGADITEIWDTAVVNAENLERAYNKGYEDCRKEML